jgi:hypothetical protein
VSSRHRVCRHHTPIRIAAATAIFIAAVGAATIRGTALGHADAQDMCTVTTTAKVEG